MSIIDDLIGYMIGSDQQVAKNNIDIVNTKYSESIDRYWEYVQRTMSIPYAASGGGAMASSTTSSAYSYRPQCGKGNIQLLAGGIESIQAVTSNGRKNSWPGYTQADMTLFQFVGKTERTPNFFHPLFAQYLTEFARAVMPILGWSKFKFTSGFRTLNENNIIRGAANSPHMAGIAMDVHAYAPDGTDQRQRFAAEAYMYGFGGIAIGRGFVHIDMGPVRRWTYANSDINFTPPGGAA